MLRQVLFVLALLSYLPIQAQVIESNPSFPTETSNVTITFFADRGNEGLKDYTGDVYAHTGVITDKSTTDTDWKYVKTNWGENTPETKLTRIGTNTYILTIPNPRTYYNVPAGEKIEKLAFVFRSATSPFREGKDVGNKDIFQQIYDAGLNVRLDKPSGKLTVVSSDSTIPVFAVAGYSGSATITLKALLNGTEFYSTENDTLDTEVTITQSGINLIEVVGTDGTDSDTARARVFVLPEFSNEPRPTGIIDGINKTGSNSVTLSLYAPQKDFVFVLGDFNDWTPSEQYLMKRHEVTPDSVHFWLEINNLDPTTEYAFQYWVDAKILTGDPYSEKILDPWNDRWINEKYIAYPNLKPYPFDKTESPVTVFQIQEQEYEWKSTNFQRPNPDALVIYELLVRDFAEVATYRTLIDTIGYFKRLGINAIELMPVAEFDANDSWGYNPAYHMALDKYYGTKNDFKEFIDSCHVNGIAVVMDVVFNHATGLSPLIRMYQDDSGAPSATSIYAFSRARHPFNVFNDLNHGSSATNYWMKRVLKYWLEEFKIDGFRFDLSKGHYIDSTTDIGVWNSYNQWRINHWKDNYNFIQSVSPGSYVVLEHLANDDEERALAAHGILLWGKMTEPYNELTMGWNLNNSKSSVARSYHASRGFSTTGLVAYMESHDEERIMFKNKMYGNTSVPTHNARNLTVATQRTGTAAAFLFTIPGPKMMWMFGELGYDVSINQTAVGGPINNDNRVKRKPILWNYYNDPDRQELYRRFGDLIRLRTKYPIFHDKNSSFRIFESTALRRIELAHGTNKVNIVANFDLTTRDMRFDFPETGTWYEFFSGDTLEVTDTGASYSMLPAELRIYSKEKFDLEPYSKVVTSNEEASSKLPVQHQLYATYPNPFNPTITIQFDVPRTEMVSIEVFDVLGRQVATLVNGVRNAGSHQVQFNAQGLSSGLYLIRMQSGSFVQIQKALLIK